MAFAGDAADGMRESAEAGLGDFEVTSLLQRGDLHTEIAARRVGNLAEIDEVGTLQRVERHHDLQPQFIMQQWVNNGKLKCTHILWFLQLRRTLIIIDKSLGHNVGTNALG